MDTANLSITIFKLFDMKKILFLLIAMLSITLTSCSLLESEPIEPKIIGTGNLQYEDKSGTWFVAVGSNQYTIANVTVPDHGPRTSGKTQNIEPVEGMLVTIFVSPRKTGVQAVTGKQSVAQIEELYHTSDFGKIIIFGLLSLCILGMAAASKDKKVSVVNADV